MTGAQLRKHGNINLLNSQLSYSLNSILFVSNPRLSLIAKCTKFMHFLSTPIRIEATTFQQQTFKQTQELTASAEYSFSTCLFYECENQNPDRKENGRIGGAISVDLLSFATSLTVTDCTFFCCRSPGTGGINVGEKKTLDIPRFHKCKLPRFPRLLLHLCHPNT